MKDLQQQLQQERAYTEKATRSLSSMSKDLKKALDEFLPFVSLLESSKESLYQQFTELQKMYEERVQEVSHLQDTIRTFKEKYKDAFARVMTQEELTSFEAQLKEYQEQLDARQEELDKREDYLAEVADSTEVRKLRKRLQSRQEAIDHLREKHRLLLETKEQDLESLRETIRHLQTDSIKTRNDLAAMRQLYAAKLEDVNISQEMTWALSFASIILAEKEREHSELHPDVPFLNEQQKLYAAYVEQTLSTLEGKRPKDIVEAASIAPVHPPESDSSSNKML